MLDYYEIGQRIRTARKIKGLSQEELAEKIGISTTHMSHIETGNTKLSLAVLVDIAEVLQATTDSLLFDYSRKELESVTGEIENVLKNCSVKQAEILLQVIANIKNSIEQYYKAE